MSVTMRIIQRFDAPHEEEFMRLEQKFAELEARRPDYPKGKRMQPISAALPSNSFIWQCEFPDIQSAHQALSFFHGDDEHEELFAKQGPLIRDVHIELYQNLEF
jgi:hypothetical protein